jgi:hypothetical protein
MRRFMNDTAYRDFFYFGWVAILHIAVPKPYPIVMIYFFFVAIIGHCVLFAIGQFRFLFITYLVKNVLVFTMIMTLLVDGWCDFFQYRGNNGQGRVDN